MGNGVLRAERTDDTIEHQTEALAEHRKRKNELCEFFLLRDEGRVTMAGTKIGTGGSGAEISVYTDTIGRFIARSSCTYKPIFAR